jgi:hypothetical protein
MQGDEEQAEIPDDEELSGMHASDLRTLTKGHGCERHKLADMCTWLSQIRDHGEMFCPECEDGVKRPLYPPTAGASYEPTNQPERQSLL